MLDGKVSTKVALLFVIPICLAMVMGFLLMNTLLEHQRATSLLRDQQLCDLASIDEFVTPLIPKQDIPAYEKLIHKLFFDVGSNDHTCNPPIVPPATKPAANTHLITPKPVQVVVSPKGKTPKTILVTPVPTRVSNKPHPKSSTHPTKQPSKHPVPIPTKTAVPLPSVTTSPICIRVVIGVCITS